MAFLAIIITPVASHAQCNFTIDKKNPSFRYISQTIGPASYQWSLSVGKQSEQYYLQANVVTEGKSVHTINGKDFLYVDLATGERLMLSPVNEVKPEAATQNGKPATSYHVRYALSKEQMDKLAYNHIDNISVTNRQLL
jgi:hypothetical protein